VELLELFLKRHWSQNESEELHGQYSNLLGKGRVLRCYRKQLKVSDEQYESESSWSRCMKRAKTESEIDARNL